MILKNEIDIRLYKRYNANALKKKRLLILCNLDEEFEDRMERKKRVLLGMSGGVDSSVAAILLKEQGFDVIGVTMKLYDGEVEGGCCNLESTLDAKRVCDFLEIPHYTVNFKEEFQEHVICDFIGEYKACRTPNPCIECNKFLKFGAMFQKAKELECDYIATGHYAKVEWDDRFQQVVLKKSRAGKKDQSYVLYSIPRELLSRVQMPLCDFENKAMIREIAEKYHLPVAKKPDSEDICFIPDGDYKKFLVENSDIQAKVGNIVTKDGKVLGKHNGLYRYTIGQRKGLGISNPVPLFVLGFDRSKNELIVGEETELYQKAFCVDQLNWLLFDDLKETMDVEVKVRYSAIPAKAKIVPQNGEVLVLLEEPQRAITPGQSAVFYLENVVIGGGKIKE